MWELAPERHEPGRVDHYLGYPLDNGTAGGGFAYHAQNRRLYLGHVTHLSYTDPTLSPFGEFQRFKSHPAIAGLLEGATRLSYGARALTTGGLQSIPDLAFSGGALIGCAAGFMNVPALKAIHSAIRSGRATAEQVAAAIAEGRAHDRLEGLNAAVLAHRHRRRNSPPVRNVEPLWTRAGTMLGVALGGFDLWFSRLFRASPFGTLQASARGFRKVEAPGGGDAAPLPGARRGGELRPRQLGVPRQSQP